MPQSTEFVSESRYSAKMMSELTKSIIEPTHQRCNIGYKQRTRRNNFRCEQNSVKGVENPSHIGTRGMSIEGFKESMWLKRPAWLQRSKDKWPKPWCQENELEPEQVTRTVAIETKLYQLFDWRQYSTFKRIRKFVAYCMRFKTK